MPKITKTKCQASVIKTVALSTATKIKGNNIQSRFIVSFPFPTETLMYLIYPTCDIKRYRNSFL